MSGSIDITDLVRGDGEWKNMQEVVRKTFKLFFEHMERQNEQIANLTTQMAVMQRDLARVPTIKDVDKAIEMKVKYSRKSPSSDELDKITSAIYNIKSDMERKASIRYVDETMRKKMDKSDAVALQLSQIAASKYTDDIAKIKRDLMDDKVRSEGLARSTFEIQEQVKSLQLYQESKSWKPQVDNLYDMMTRFYDKDQINMLLDNKVESNNFKTRIDF